MTSILKEEDCTILLVEDGHTSRTSIDNYLKEDNYRLLFAAGFDDALQILECERINLVVMGEDILGSTAFELCSKIRATEHLCEVPVLMIVDPQDSGMHTKGFAVGVDDFINTPVKPETLRARVKTITRLNRYRILHESNLLLEEQEKQLSRLKSFDPITGLANFSTFKESLEKDIVRAERSGYAVAVLSICANEFDKVLGVYGQAEADDLARQIADRLTQAGNSRGFTGRIDGRCFIAHKPIPTEDDLLVAVHHYRKRFNETFYVNGEEIKISSSIGASAFPADSTDAEKLISMSVSAMTRASNLGRNKYHVYAPSASADVKRQLRLESQITRALNNEDLELHYQPQIQLGNGRVRCVEALMRMSDETGTQIPPNLFLPVAQDCGLMHDLSVWALNQACEHAAVLAANGYNNLRVSVNLSGDELRHPNFLNDYETALTNANINGQLIELEINENALTPQPGFDLQTITNILKSVRSHGTTISVDDFGTGYSSLRYLRHFPLDAIKIDQSFVRDVPDDPKATAVVRSVISLGHNLGLRVTAEGVESDQQLRFLRSVQCDDVQGYLYSKSVPFDQLPHTLKQLQTDWHETNACSIAETGIAPVMNATGKVVDGN